MATAKRQPPNRPAFGLGGGFGFGANYPLNQTRANVGGITQTWRLYAEDLFRDLTVGVHFTGWLIGEADDIISTWDQHTTLTQNVCGEATHIGSGTDRIHTRTGEHGRAAFEVIRNHALVS